MKDVQIENYDFEPDDEFGIDSTGYNATVTENEGRQLSQAFHSNRNSYHSNTAMDSEENEIPRALSSDRNSYYSNRNSYHGNESDINRSSFISSVENGELFGDSGKRNSYRALDNDVEHTDIFPNGTSELNINSNTYQSETAFT